MYLLFWCVLLKIMMFYNTVTYVVGNYCVTGQSKPGDPKLPDINVTAFIIEYQINIIDRKYTMYAREEYDYVANMARMTMIKAAKEEGIIMDYSSNVIISYWYDDIAKSTYTCTIDQLNTSQSDNFHVFGGASAGTKSMPHIYSSRDLFRFDSSLGETYLGNTTIDGVPVDHWQSCMYWADDKDNFTLDYYFTTPDWNPIDPNSPKQIPIRAVVTGIKDTGGGSTTVINHLYEYLNFRVYPKLPAENFALPSNMKCEDAKGLRKKPLPSMPNRMSYTVEIVDGDCKMVEVLYDEERQLVWSLETNVISIDDFNTGVHYSIDKTTQVCSTRPISADVDNDADESSKCVSLKSRQELFYLDGDFTYSGQADVRGIRCDAWVRTKVVQGISSNVEVYFSLTSENYRESSSGQVLVSLVVSSNLIATTYNFFDQMSSPDISTDPFDITACRNESSKMDFRVVFRYTPDDVFQAHHQYSLIHDALSTLTHHLTGMTSLQVHWTDLEVDDVNKQLHWLGSFLDPEPNSPRAHVINSTDSVFPFQALSLLQQAINNGIFVATVLLPSEGSSGPVALHLLALEIRNVKNDIDFADASDIFLGQFIIIHNMRAMNFTPEESMYSTSAMTCAAMCVKKSIYECRSFSYCFRAKRCQLSSRRCSNDTMIQTRGCNFYSRDFTSDFMKIPGRIVRREEQELARQVSSVQTCANLCLKNTSFDCESFDYCEADQDCYLGKTHYYVTSSSDMRNSTLCDHYSKNYVADYVKSSDTALVLNNSSLISPLIIADSSPTHCAYVCSENTVDCVRFSFCSSTHQCQIVTSSTIRSIELQASSFCDVYTLKSVQQTNRSGGRTNGTSRSVNTDSEHNYSAGSMAGLAIGMAIVGMLLPIFILFVLWKLKKYSLF